MAPLNDESVEEWARTAHFPQPIRFGDIEAGVLAHEPLSADGMEWWMPIATFVSWIGYGVVYILGLGAPVLGLLFVWLGTRGDASADGGSWLSVAQLVFVCSALVEVSLLHAAWKSRRNAVDWATALLVAAASSAALALSRPGSGQDVPGLLTLGIVATGVLAVGVFLVSLFSKSQVDTSSKTPPPRGPRNEVKRVRYRMSRERVLEILVQRGVVKIDEADRQRLREMPLGYWEEIDGVDERERRRILEYRIVGWRTFDKSDERPWPPVPRG